MIETETAVIGAGMAGLVLAAHLASYGRAVAVFDKGRGLGGRLATRHSSAGFSYDHGAQYLRPRLAPFRSFLMDLTTRGFAERWPAAGPEAFVGQPGMRSLLAPIAAGLAIRCGTEIASVRREGGDWLLADAGGAALARAPRLAVAVPSPQAARLLSGQAVAAPLDRVSFAPCWTLMAAFDGSLPLPDCATNPVPGVGWIARDSAKPGRSAHPERWVVQADAAWSRAHLELERDEVCTLLMDLLTEAAGGAMPECLHSGAHRWRYSAADRPLGRPCLADAEARLVVIGDWCLGSRAEDAFDSARAGIAALEMM